MRICSIYKILHENIQHIQDVAIFFVKLDVRVVPNRQLPKIVVFTEQHHSITHQLPQ
jgi:hypothetical protein